MPIPDNVFSASSTNITVDKTASVIITSVNNGTITYNIDNEEVVSCEWADDWEGDTVKLYITGKSIGETKIRITNKYNDKVLVINVNVVDYNSIFSVSSTNLTVNKTATITLTSENNGAVKYYVENSYIASCEWADEWEGNTLKLYVTGKRIGNTKITISNEKNDKVLTINVSVVQALKSGKELLKEYISQYGRINVNGNKFISSGSPSGDDEFTYAVVYEEYSDSFLFLMTHEEYTNKDSLSMTVPMYNAPNLKPEYIFVHKRQNAAFTATGIINVNSFSNDTKPQFIIEDMVGFNSSMTNTLVELAGVSFNLSMSGWDILLMEQVGIRMMDIGFTLYE